MNEHEIYFSDMQDTLQEIILDDIKKERARQDALHPQKLNLAMRFITIMEELGEVAECMQEDDKDGICRELVDAAASCVRMIEEVKTNA